MQPDTHAPGSPLPRSYYAAEVGYLVDGTDMLRAGNLSVQAGAASAPISSMPSPASPPVAAPTPVAASFTSTAEALHGISFSYSMQKDAYADYEFLNDVGFWDSDFIFSLGETSNILEMPTCSPPPLCQFVFDLASGG